ncbi:beta-lactamase family protein [Lutimonas saemankumensis]|uniref:serine hydrolase domain-containing protein n=1 Tax=Lutimonas saemankumensis TaxID=483016 RepID=UPI001CD521F7|nr:serine hydrolase domain-containing protein [Lutimonas saemankumensis]MCA0931402.1 beta-lactamase family protein [Lutimonas saemankumensis]
MKILVSLILICALLACSSNKDGRLNPVELEAKIDSLVPTQVNDTTPGLIVGIVRGGEIIFSKGYGLANLSYGIANDPSMVFNTGSVTKQFLGYAFAILHVEGKLSLDDPVSKHLENWPEFDHTVTLRHLLTHTSGYREAYTMSNLSGRIIGVDRLSREECLNVVRKQPQLEFVPGSRWTYNSTAWVILAEVLEKVTGQTADEWVAINIFNPLGMKDTQIESYVGEVIFNSAESYVFNKEEGYANQESNRAIFGAAEIYSNVPDLAKWTSNFRTAQVGGSEVHDLFLTPFILNDGTDSEYALGIGVGTYRGLKRYRHTGGHEAFSTQLSYYPDHDLGIITISNFGGKGWISTEKIADLFLEDYMTTETAREYAEINLDMETLEQFQGLYLSSDLNDSFTLKMVEDSLTYEEEENLIPRSPNSFGIEGWNGLMKIENLEDGTTRLTIENGTIETYKRVERWSPEVAELKKFEDDYWSEELETLYHVVVKDDQLQINHRWLGDIMLKPISPDLFETDWGYTIKFLRNPSNEIDGLSVNSGRTLNVLFERINN